MMRALFSAVSGLKAQQYGLDVVANNIANVNTTGYKASRVSFSDLLSQTISGATASTGTTGGTNPTQIGLGVSVSGTQTLFTVGSSQTTGVATDVSLSGDGLFVVKGGGTGEYQYTRAGDFSIDSSGNLTVDGYLVCGWEQYTVDSDGNYVFNTDAEVDSINLYSDSYNGNKKILLAEATTEADFSGNLDPSVTAATTAAISAIDTTQDLATNLGTTLTADDYDQTSSITCYDSQGNTYDVTVSWKKVTSESGTTLWYWQADTSDAATVSSPSYGYVEFNSNGTIVTGDSTYSTTPSITVTPDNAGVSAFPVTFDFSNVVTNTSSSTSSVTGTADGYEAGDLQSISISTDGIIYGTYSNGQTQALAQIAVATFTNYEGLEKSGDNLYVETVNSGDPVYTTAGSGGSGKMSSGTLEMSNVDLAEQFSQMMIYQRAYQANSKIISTADEMLQSLINMK